jgi:hypothetical protein
MAYVLCVLSPRWHTILCWVNSIDAIAIFAYLRNATTTFNFEKTPLHLCVYLMDAITSTYAAYTSQYTWYFQPYVCIHGGVHQNQRKNKLVTNINSYTFTYSNGTAIFIFISFLQFKFKWAEHKQHRVMTWSHFTRKSINYGFLFRILVLTCSRELFCTSMIANITSGMKARWIHKLDPTCNINRCIIFTSWMPVRCHGPIKLD